MTKFPGSFPRRRKPHYVYEVWRNSECIYVGMTEQVGARFGRHSTQSPWWALATDIKIAVVPDREHALDLEAHLIGKYEPTYNWCHVAPEVRAVRGRTSGATS